MDKLKKSLTVQRTAFTKTLATLMAEIEKETRDAAKIQVTLSLLTDKATSLDIIDKEIQDAMLDSNSTEEEMTIEIEAADEYKTRFETVKLEVQRVLNSEVGVLPRNGASGSATDRPSENSRNLKLPKIELKKFNGDSKEWLKFWGIFNKVHEDANILEVEKFQYLLQATVENSRASELVNSYPPTAANCTKVIESLKSRFGRDDLLVEVYFRELLKLVLNKSRGSLRSVYDKLETHLRALESLGVTSEMCAAMLLPLVESSLPEEILRTWQRQNNSGPDASVRLKALMKFLGSEVESEERISMAKVGFELSPETAPTADKVEKRLKPPAATAHTGVVTAAELYVKEVKLDTCIFCQEQHESARCQKAKQMPLNVRQDIVKEKRACFACLKLNHSYQKCCSNIKCQWRGRKHTLLMCRDISQNVKNKEPLESQTNGPAKNVENLTASCNNITCNSVVYLQTLYVKIKGPLGERVVRALIDTGSHKTYVRRSVADDMKLKIIGQQKMVHLLFGGEKTEPRVHNEYQFNLQSLDGSYECIVNAYQEDVICRDLPAVAMGPWIEKLLGLGVTLTDTASHSEPIALLIGADVAERLYTGHMYHIERGPTALKTKLGWTLTGRSTKAETMREDATLTVFSMFTREAKISDLWELDVLGITDPIVTESKEAHLAKIKEQFQPTIQVNDEGRYEVLLPWKDNHPPLSRNRAIAEKRLQASTLKLRKEHLYEPYDKVFDDWL